MLSGPEYTNSKSNDFDVKIAGFSENREDLSQHLLCKFDYGYFASKEYIQLNGKPETEKDLYNHSLLLFAGEQFIPDHIIDNSRNIIETNSYPALFEMCLEGIGIASLSLDIYNLLMQENKIKYSKLVRILPKIISEQDNIYFSFFRFTNKEKAVRELFEISKNLIKNIIIDN